MNPKLFFSNFKYSAIALVKNPIIILPAIIFFLFLYFFPMLSNHVKDSLTTNLANILWFAFFLLLFIAIASFVSASIIGLSKEAITGRANLMHIFSYGKRFFLRNCVLVGISLILFGILNYLSTYISIFIGNYFGLSAKPALGVFLIIYFASLAGILIFLTFSSFYLVVFNLPIIASLRKSINFVRKNYVELVTFGVLLFIINYILGYVQQYNSLLSDLINILIIVPYIFMFLTRFLIKFNK